jgi:hypothetical protein
MAWSLTSVVLLSARGGRWALSRGVRLLPRQRHISGNGLLKAFGVELSQRNMSVENTDAPSRRPWILRWLNDETDEQKIMDLKEKEEREDILRRVQEMYYAKPPQTPDLAFYKEAFQCLMKYNDRSGVRILWSLMAEEKVSPDEELEEQVNDFLERTKKSQWFDL